MEAAPLAEKLRPETLDEFVGQEHLVGDNSPLRVAMKNKHKFSFILWGPPGTGKTTLAKIYARSLEAEFYFLSAVSAGKDDIRKIINSDLTTPKQKILFLDEIHRFNKAQQDYLLPYVENGTITLIGATTENPSFEVIAPLLSRCQVFVLSTLTKVELQQISLQCEQYLKVKLDDDARDFIVEFSNGDARALLNLLETATSLYLKRSDLSK